SDPPHRPLRLLRRVRHRRLTRRPGAGPGRAGPRRRAGRRRGGRRAGVPRGRRGRGRAAGVSPANLKILVKEKIADTGVDLLPEHFDVDVGVDWSDDDLADRIADYDGILIRSATKLTADLIGRADRLKVIGRAGVGVDNG